ncbi:MAG: ATP-dependent Clp protease adapter ClpS [Formivibrio sp.]|nr:ATP-dependent Clp protease adapter ClpS [Formivibrio sp.]
MAIKHQQETDLAPQKVLIDPPAMWRVVLLNDDFTPMDFVTTVLQTFFAMDYERATQIMLKIHTEGRGICGVFPKDVAATKVSEVTHFARQHQHPLQCIMEIR